MSISPRDPQTRLPLLSPLSQHDQRCAATLVNLQIWGTAITAATTIGVGIDIDTDVIRGSTATAAANLAVTLPLGSPEIIGHVYELEKTNSDAYTFGFACQGSDTFDDATTLLAQAAQYGTVRTYWNGSKWRKLAAGATGGALPPASSGTIGDGTGSPTLTLNKSDAGVGTVAFTRNTATARGKLQLDASEDFVMSVYAGNGSLLGSITLDHASGAVTISGATSISSGGLTIGAGGLDVTAGGLRVASGAAKLDLASTIAYADDAAAAVGGVPVGGVYRTASALKIRAA